MENPHHTFVNIEQRILMIGFGCIGQAVMPLLFRHLSLKPEQMTIITKHNQGSHIANEYGVNVIIQSLTNENYKKVLDGLLRPGDFLLNLSVDVSSLALIQYCQSIKALYLDTCVEPWAGGYTDISMHAALRTNYALREAVLKLKTTEEAPTAVITHGANPGLVSYFLKQALLNMAKENNIAIPPVLSQQSFATLAQQLNIKVIHIAERDTQKSTISKKAGEFVNTWSIDGFVAEGSQPAELGWGSHEKHFPKDANVHNNGPQCAIYLNRPGASTRVRTWTPKAGPFHGFLITHSEAISIADYYTIKKNDQVIYRPTVHYAYHPCEDAVLSLHELAGHEWEQQKKQRLLFHDIIDGTDELGVLLMGNEKGAYWFGSELTIHEARQLVPHNTATSLQVAIGVLAGMVFALKNKKQGIIEPDEINHEEILAICLPYLGKVAGYYTDWNPLKERERLFTENIDKTDPWQFINIRVE